MTKKTNTVSLVILLVVWGVACLLAWFLPARELSLSERRKLAQKPQASIESILSGKYMTDFESYSLDQFPARDFLRTVKAYSVYDLFRQKDNNGIFIQGGSAAKLDYPLNVDSVRSAAEKLAAVYDRYLAGKRAYLAVVPDKSYFLAAANGYPAMDYDALFAAMQEELSFAQYVDLTAVLSADDYYRTDAHWRQENLAAAAQTIAQAMGVTLSEGYEEISTDVPFYGVYCGQAAVPLHPDTIRYLTNDTIAACTVTHLETGKTLGVYDDAKLESRDPYEFFLSGASAVIYVENPNAATERELVVFRDSNGSSLVPLLLEGYSKVTLVDTRYIAPDLLADYVDFAAAGDVLFLYGTTLLNASATMK